MPGTCFFLGYPDAPPGVYPSLLAAIRAQIDDHGVDRFFVMAYGPFEALAVRALQESKAHSPHIACLLVTPYPPDKHPARLPDGFDAVVYPFGRYVPPRCASILAHKQMIETCDSLIACAPKTGIAADLFAYARRLESQGRLRIARLNPGFDP